MDYDVVHQGSRQGAGRTHVHMSAFSQGTKFGKSSSILHRCPFPPTLC
jgi:hypothetical protein